MPHRMLCWIWLRMGLELANPPAGFTLDVHHLAADGVEFWSAREAGQLDVAEAVIGEARLVDLFRAVAAQDVSVGGPGIAQVLDVQRAVVVEQLGVAQLDLGAARAADAQLDPAAEVLPHVVDIHAGAGAGHPGGHDGVEDADGRHHLRRKDALGRFHQRGGPSRRRRRSRGDPSRGFPGARRRSRRCRCCRRRWGPARFSRWRRIRPRCAGRPRTRSRAGAGRRGNRTSPGPG